MLSSGAGVPKTFGITPCKNNPYDKKWIHLQKHQLDSQNKNYLKQIVNRTKNKIKCIITGLLNFKDKG